MDVDEIMRYAGNRNGYIGIDLRFDYDTKTPRVVEICYFRSAWSIDIKYLTYDIDASLDDSQFTQAIVTGNYDSLSKVIESIEDYINMPISNWHNYSKSGYSITLTPEEMSAYRSIDWENWRPDSLIVPKGSVFDIIRPDEWLGVTHLTQSYQKST
jgi:hypothetical protein